MHDANRSCNVSPLRSSIKHAMECIEGRKLPYCRDSCVNMQLFCSRPCIIPNASCKIAPLACCIASCNQSLPWGAPSHVFSTEHLCQGLPRLPCRPLSQNVVKEALKSLRLQAHISSDRDQYAPGDEVLVRIQCVDPITLAPPAASSAIEMGIVPAIQNAPPLVVTIKGPKDEEVWS